MTKESPSGAPYLNVMSSGCFFFDVILTIAERRRLTTMCAKPFRPGMSRSTYMWLSVTRRWLEKKRKIHIILFLQTAYCTGAVQLLWALRLLIFHCSIPSNYISCHWTTGNISRHIQGHCIHSFEGSICSALDIFCMLLASDFLAFFSDIRNKKIAHWAILSSGI